MAAKKKELWEGMRVLAVDEDRVCLKILEAKLRRFNYDVTPAKDGKTVLRTLGKAREPFDLVITELHMPDMDALDLIRRIAFGMGIPVIVLSAYEDTKTVRNALISSGACSYLAKPVCADQLKNIWQHVIRRKNELARNHKSCDNTVADQRVQRGIAEAEQGAKSTRMNSRTKRNDGHDSNSGKKPRLRWTKELHGKFVEAIDRLGTNIDSKS
ncbi:two-component response regulator ORR24-like [Brachypodium distachyon]|uniref:two-component response regulator ORR24-like n=1 Tax=Brachypodium distachyon TaxID=15368 RepID=UPI0005300257|nr:two-component response regulator ORR24-like [Brachypodium distachyon]|eukprot:XP_024313184.1 two-component response regulator ORR24-like [Brachypodium distachyon]